MTKTAEEVINDLENQTRGCPACDNRRGFAFGTCVDCGFNQYHGKFETIKIPVSYAHLPVDHLVLLHAKRYIYQVTKAELDHISRHGSHSDSRCFCMPND